MAPVHFFEKWHYFVQSKNVIVLRVKS